MDDVGGFKDLFPEATASSNLEEMRQPMIAESISECLLVSVVTKRSARELDQGWSGSR